MIILLHQLSTVIETCLYTDSFVKQQHEKTYRTVLTLIESETASFGANYVTITTI
jgi:hypothetical protein